jgi:hypothetical protein
MQVRVQPTGLLVIACSVFRHLGCPQDSLCLAFGACAKGNERLVLHAMLPVVYSSIDEQLATLCCKA